MHQVVLYNGVNLLENLNHFVFEKGSSNQQTEYDWYKTKSPSLKTSHVDQKSFQISTLSYSCNRVPCYLIFKNDKKDGQRDLAKIIVKTTIWCWIWNVDRGELTASACITFKVANKNRFCTSGIIGFFNLVGFEEDGEGGGSENGGGDMWFVVNFLVKQEILTMDEVHYQSVISWKRLAMMYMIRCIGSFEWEGELDIKGSEAAKLVLWVASP